MGGKGSGTSAGTRNAVIERNKERALLNPTDENQKALAYLMELRELPKIDKGNPTELEALINEYLKITYNYKMKPGDASLAVAMHCNTNTIKCMRAGTFHKDPRIQGLMGEFKTICEAILRNAMLDAKNPAGFIFDLKANHGWQEVQKYQIEEVSNTRDAATTKAIEQKYLDSVVIDFNGKPLTIGKPEQIEIEGEAEDVD